MKGILGKHFIGMATFFTLLASASGASEGTPRSDPSQIYRQKADWKHTMQACREALQRIDVSDKEKTKLSAQVFGRIMRHFPIRADWMLQDYGRDAHQWLTAQDNHEQQIRMIEHVLVEVGRYGHACRVALTNLKHNGIAGDDSRWLDL